MLHHTWEQPTTPTMASFRGLCLYKTGKCTNERALKTNGQAHNLCNMHRLKQNQNQRKMDSKVRHRKGHTYYVPRAPRQLTPSPTRHEISPPATPPQTSRFRPPHDPTPFAPPTHAATYRHQPSHHVHDGHLPPSSSTSFLHHAAPVHPTVLHNNAGLNSDDDDSITVPTPSFLKGEAREAFRSRVLQKLLHIISEEVGSSPVPPAPAHPPHQPSYTEAAYYHHHPHAPHYDGHQHHYPAHHRESGAWHHHPHNPPSHHYDLDRRPHDEAHHNSSGRRVLPPLSVFHAPPTTEF